MFFVASFASICTQFSLFPRSSSGVSSIERILSEYLMKEVKAFNVVVLPDEEPPQISMFIGSIPKPSTIIQINPASSEDIVLFSIKLIMLKGILENFLMVREGPKGVAY